MKGSSTTPKDDRQVLLGTGSILTKQVRAEEDSQHDDEQQAPEQGCTIHLQRR